MGPGPDGPMGGMGAMEQHHMNGSLGEQPNTMLSTRHELLSTRPVEPVTRWEQRPSEGTVCPLVAGGGSLLLPPRY